MKPGLSSGPWSRRSRLLALAIAFPWRVLAATLVASAAVSGAAVAQTATDQRTLVHDARLKGVVGELSTGLLGFRQPSSDAALAAAVAAVNATRLQAVAHRGLRPEEMYPYHRGRMINGEWYRDADGVWRQVPPLGSGSASEAKP